LVSADAGFSLSAVTAGSVLNPAGETSHALVVARLEISASGFGTAMAAVSAIKGARVRSEKRIMDCLNRKVL